METKQENIKLPDTAAVHQTSNDFCKDQGINESIQEKLLIQPGKESIFTKLGSVIDILLYLTFISTNFYLAYTNYYSNSNNNESWKYGVYLIIILWLPAFILVPNEIFFHTALVKTCNLQILAVKTILGISIFPVLPLVLQTAALRNEDEKYLARFKTINCLNQIIFTSLHLVLLIFITMKGQVHPEDQGVCDIQSLEYSMVLSALTSIILYVKSVSHLLSKDKNAERNIFYLTPWITSALMFRTSSYALILNYMDYWATIPLTIIFIVFTLQQGKESMEENTDILKLKENTKHTEGPYAMIWKGHEWTCIGLNQQQINLKYQISDTSDKLSFLLKGFINTFAPMFYDNCTNLKAVISDLMRNGLITLTIVTIFVFVNLVGYLQYSQIILSDTDFNKLATFLVCYGLFSSILLILGFDYSVKFVQSICTIVLLFIVIVVIPVFACSLMCASRPKHSFQLFVIKSNSSGAHINILATLKSSQSNLEGKYETSDIYFDATCKRKVFHDKALLFVNLRNSDCIKIANVVNNTASLLSVNHEQTYKTSLPQALIQQLSYVNLDMNFSKLQDIIYAEGYVFVSNTSYLSFLSNQLKNTSCSSSTDVELKPIIENLCTPGKYLNEGASIFENICTDIMGFNHAVTMNCGYYNSSFALLNNGIELQSTELLNDFGDIYESCCLNETLSVQLYGDCKFWTSDNLNNIIYNELGICDKRYFFQENIGYSFRKGCLSRISYISPCKKPFEAFNNCKGFTCNFFT